MDLQLMSLQNSPLSQVLLSDSNMSPFVYSVYSSLPPTSRQKVEVPAPSTLAYDKSASFNVPRYGLLCAAVLKVRITANSTTNLGTNYGNMLIKRATLSSHSREILALESIGNFVKVLDKPLDVSATLMNVAYNAAPTFATGTAGDYDVYVPLNFSVFDNASSYLDTSFIEQLEVNVSLNDSASLLSASTAAISATNSAMIFYYLNMSESDLRSLQNAQYSLEKPLSILAKSYFRENPVKHTATATGDYMATVQMTCPNLMTRTFIGITSDAIGEIGNFLSVKSVKIKSSGRELYNYAVNDNFLENALFYAKGNLKGNLTGNTYNVFVHNWGLYGNDSQFSGGISGKGSSNLMLEITYAETSGGAYTVVVESEYQNIISISSGSGKISNSISL